MEIKLKDNFSDEAIAVFEDIYQKAYKKALEKTNVIISYNALRFNYSTYIYEYQIGLFSRNYRSAENFNNGIFSWIDQIAFYDACIDALKANRFYHANVLKDLDFKLEIKHNVSVAHSIIYWNQTLSEIVASIKFYKKVILTIIDNNIHLGDGLDNFLKLNRTDCYIKDFLKFNHLLDS